MGSESRKAGEEQGQMKDQEEFQEDPRGRQEVSDQQPETNPADDGEDRDAEDGGERSEQRRGESGRDDGGEATGNPANAG